MNETTYYDKGNVRVTSHRMVFKGKTIAIDNLGMVWVNHRIGRFVAAMVSFLLSFWTLTYGYDGLFYITTAFIWLFWECKHYAEVWIIHGGEKTLVTRWRLSDTPLAHELEDAVKTAMEKNHQMRESGELEHTDTMKVTLKVNELASA